MLSNIIILLAIQFLAGTIFGIGMTLVYQWRQRKQKAKLRELRLGTRVE